MGSGRGPLAGVGLLLRRLHQAFAGYAADRRFAAQPGARWFTRPLPPGVTARSMPAAPAPQPVSHNDVTPHNVVVREGRAVAFIGFDPAGPTTRLIDVCTAAMHWVPLRDPVDVWPAWTSPPASARWPTPTDSGTNESRWWTSAWSAPTGRGFS